jgi:predicted enzyme related to lactoylglutathione lyase
MDVERPTLRRYPEGVTSWIDTDQPDVDAALVFYGDLFGWTFTDVLPPDAPGRYVIAALEGRDVAGIAGPSGGPTSWNTYVAVVDVDATTERLAALGARVVVEPADAGDGGDGGRTSTLEDPEGVEFRLWQARRRLGAQAANEPGAWNFSDLHTGDVAGAIAFYSEAFGWLIEDQGWAVSIRVPGYGDHLAATIDPDVHARQASAPEGFADVIGGVGPVGEGEPPHWHVTFTVADRDESAATVERLGGAVVSTFDNEWVRAAVVRDPAGSMFTLSQFAPAEWG